MNVQQIHDRIYRVAGPDITDSRDCSVYLLDLEEPLLIDCGSGYAFRKAVANITDAGFDPAAIRNVVLTHCHVDHIGAAHLFRSSFGSRLIMHELDAQIVERGDQLLTAAFCFEMDFQPLSIDLMLTGTQGPLLFGKNILTWIHTPGHTPGSISLCADIDGERIIFVQDIAAPILKEFYCDPGAWVRSVDKLMALDADMLCDGHSAAYYPKKNVQRYFRNCIASQRRQGHLDS